MAKLDSTIIYGSLSVNSIISSMIATGMSPFNITSTTLVPNLNVDMVDGLHVHAGTTNNEANKIVRTDGNGFILGAAIYDNGNRVYSAASRPTTLSGYGITDGVNTQYNSSLNSDSRNSRGVTRLYRRDSDSDYSLQTYFDGARWVVEGYSGDTYHAGCKVEYSAYSTATANITTQTGSTNGNYCPVFVDSATPGSQIPYNSSNFLYNPVQNVLTVGTVSGNLSGVATRATRANGNFNIDDNFGNSIVGLYRSDRFQGVYAMDDEYKMPADGTSLSGLYGLAWSHPNAGGQAAGLTNHGLIVVSNGAAISWISDSIKTVGRVTGSEFYGAGTGLTGTAASLTAGSVTNANFYRQFTVRDDRSDGSDYSLAARPTGLYAMVGSGTNGPSGASYCSLLHIANSNDVGFQITGGYTTDKMWFRGTSALQSGTGYTTWRQVWHDGNLTPSSYQPLATAINTGNIAAQSVDFAAHLYNNGPYAGDDTEYKIAWWSGGQSMYSTNSLYFKPASGFLYANAFYGAGTGLTGTASSLSVNYATSAGSAPTSDGAVTYAKVATNLKSSSGVGSTIDLSGSGIGTITLSANTSFTFTNFELNKTYLLIVTANGYTPSFATAAKHVFVEGNASLSTTGVYYINLTCINSTSGSEKLLTTILKGV